MNTTNQNRYGQTRSFNLGIADEFDIPTAILFDELSFLSTKAKRADGWVYKKYSELQERLPLSEYQIRESYKKLEEAGWIKKKIMKANGQPTVHYMVLKSLSLETKKTLDSETQKTLDSIETKKTLDSITATHTATHSTSVLATDVAEPVPAEDFTPEPAQAQKYAGKKEIDGIITLFESAYKVRMKAKPKERQYASHIVKRFGYAEARKLVVTCLGMQDETYFPRVSKPSELWNKLAEISHYFKHNEKRNDKSSGAIYV